ncbi:hypothetical protein, partial [Shewanella marisflavi]|uniref:hypothetical protein n=1 Tax=Shewanella marisflavi TaxID=260364 RepID=UPI003AADA048
RLELSHLAAPEPKSGVSTNSTTPALHLVLHPDKDSSHMSELLRAQLTSKPQVLHLEQMAPITADLPRIRW